MKTNRFDMILLWGGRILATIGLFFGLFVVLGVGYLVHSFVSSMPPPDPNEPTEPKRYDTTMVYFGKKGDPDRFHIFHNMWRDNVGPAQTGYFEDYQYMYMDSMDEKAFMLYLIYKSIETGPLLDNEDYFPVESIWKPYIHWKRKQGMVIEDEEAFKRDTRSKAIPLFRGKVGATFQLTENTKKPIEGFLLNYLFFDSSPSFEIREQPQGTYTLWLLETKFDNQARTSLKSTTEYYHIKLDKENYIIPPKAVAPAR